MAVNLKNWDCKVPVWRKPPGLATAEGVAETPPPNTTVAERWDTERVPKLGKVRRSGRGLPRGGQVGTACFLGVEGKALLLEDIPGRHLQRKYEMSYVIWVILLV